ncbi:hypothetical protein HWV62_5702 [Athelia sp. TMB]|nr:hypothetical protein HWV62_5702 [Athelia sp. TMB]
MRVRSKRGDLMRQLKQLDAEAAMIQREYKSLQNITSPISSLPDEILSEVLELGKYMNPDFAIAVSHVSRQCRTVALNTPRLWNVINSKPGWGMQRIAAYFNRSGPLPVYLLVFLQETHVPAICHLLELHSGRLSQLTVTITRDHDPTRLLRCLSLIKLPILKHFTIKQAGNPVFMSHQLFSRGCPALVSLHISGLNPCIALERLPSLTAVHLSCHFFRFSQDVCALRDMLSQSTSITQLELDFETAQLIWPSDISLSMPNLQILSVKGHPKTAASHIAGFMGALRAPAMRMLTLRGELRFACDILCPKMVTWAHDFPQLRTLRCPQFPTNATETLFMMAQMLPGITDLTCVENNQDLMTLLQVYEDNGPVWPHLRTLSLLRMTGSYFTTAEITRLLVFRRSIGHPIEMIRLQEKKMGELRIEQLRSMVDIEPFKLNADWPSSSF